MEQLGDHVADRGQHVADQTGLSAPGTVHRASVSRGREPRGSAGRSPDGLQALAAEFVDLRPVQRGEFGVQGQFEHVVGQRWVSGQQRPVGIGADDLAGDRALGAVAAVARCRSPPWPAAVRPVPGGCSRRGSRIRSAIARHRRCPTQRLRISPTARTGPRVVVTSSSPRPSTTSSSSPTVKLRPMIW